MKFKWTNDLTDQCYQQAIDIRKKVFISEQGVDPDLELDENENACLHCVGYNKDGQPIATARLLPRTPDLIRIQRVAVLADYRHFGYGRTLVNECIQKAVQENYFTIELHAQLPVIEFYQDLGFSSQGEVFEEAGIQHINMILTINPKI